MWASPFKAQFRAYCDRAADLIPYLDLEELSQEAQLARLHRDRLRDVRHDLAGAERQVCAMFDEAYLEATRPFVPRSRVPVSKAGRQLDDERRRPLFRYCGNTAGASRAWSNARAW